MSAWWLCLLAAPFLVWGIARLVERERRMLEIVEDTDVWSR